MKRHQRSALSVGGGVVLLIGFLTTGTAQEAVRMSMASAEAAEARRREATATGYYNLQLGPTSWRFTTGLGLEYSDNVNYIANKPEGDFIFRPQINTRLLWPVSDRNSLNLSLGAGYSAYVQYSELDRFFITPDSGLSFDLYTGDFWINLHDRFSITENSYQDPTVVGTGNYSQFQNTVGATTVWDLNKAVLRLGYDHANYTTLSGNEGGLDTQSETLFCSAGYAPKAGMLMGIELGGALLNHTGSSTNYSDASQWNVGAFYDGQVTEYLHFQGSGGYTCYIPDSTQAGAREFSGFYAQFALTHRVNPYVDYSLSAGRSIASTLQGGTTDLYFLNWQANWRVLRKTSLATAFVFNHGTQLTYYAGETFDQYGPQITFGRPLTAKLSSSLSYQLYWRSSNEAGRDYTVNVVSLNLSYTF